MFDEPSEESRHKPLDPAQRAAEKAEEFRMHAELAAVFEGPRKFDAQLLPLDPDLAREIQRTIGRLEKSRIADIAIPPESMPDSTRLLNLPAEKNLSTNDYHLYRRPGELMIARFLQGDQVDAFYERLQAHFDAALEGFRADERQALGWKADPTTQAYLDALDRLNIPMADIYRRDPLKKHNLHLLSTQTVDELNIQYLADTIMTVPVTEVVGESSAPPDAPTDQDLAWFYELFSLRGLKAGVEQILLFAYLQKTDDSAW